MSTDAFLNAFRCTIAIRGAIQEVWCDNGSNFIGAIGELQRGIGVMQEFFAAHYCKFVLNPPHASHFGGVWERLILNVRSVLNAALPQMASRLDDYSFRTFLC